MKLWQKNLLLLLILVMIIVCPLLFKKGAEFGGSDDAASGVITEIKGQEYEPWFESIWEPPSGEIESLLFCIQGALGAGIVGFVLGRITANKKDKNKESNNIE